MKSIFVLYLGIIASQTFIHGMESVGNKKAVIAVMAKMIKENGVQISMQRNGKRIFEAPLVVNGKERLMRARFWQKSKGYAHDETFEKQGIQFGPLV